MPRQRDGRLDFLRGDATGTDNLHGHSVNWSCHRSWLTTGWSTWRIVFLPAFIAVAFLPGKPRLGAAKIRIVGVAFLGGVLALPFGPTIRTQGRRFMLATHGLIPPINAWVKTALLSTLPLGSSWLIAKLCSKARHISGVSKGPRVAGRSCGPGD